MRSKLSLLIVLIFLISFVLGACTLLGVGEPAISAEELAQTIVAETLAVEYSIQTSVAGTLAAEDEVEAPEELTPTEVPDPIAGTPQSTITETINQTPTITMTPLPDVAMVTVSVSTNCRLGPGPTYGIVGALVVGEQAEVVGVAEDGQYWVIKNPTRAGECWLWGQHASVVGPTEELPMRTPPPTPTPSPTPTPTLTPTPVYDWSGTWTTSLGEPGPWVPYNIDVTLNQSNGSVTGSFLFPGDPRQANLSGTLSSDWMTLNGTWTHLDGSGMFTFKLINQDQFIGNMNNRDFFWCGNRGVGDFPSPCMGP